MQLLVNKSPPATTHRVRPMGKPCTGGQATGEHQVPAAAVGAHPCPHSRPAPHAHPSTIRTTARPPARPHVDACTTEEGAEG